MEQSVAGQDVGVGLDTPLGIDNAGDIVELAKEVEAVEHPCEAALEHGVGQTGVPDEVVGVHAAAAWMSIVFSVSKACSLSSICCDSRASSPTRSLSHRRGWRSLTSIDTKSSMFSVP